MKLKNQPQPLQIVTSYTPLISRFGIVATGGSKTQFYYTNVGQFIPSRTVTPLLLKSYLNVVDPDGIITNGDKSSAINVQWYEGSYDNQITADTSGYTLNDNGTLTVYKDVMPGNPVQILVRATYTDARNSNTLVYEDRASLSSISKTDSTLSLTMDKPSKVIFNPIDDQATIDITATLRQGSEIVTAANYYWYTVNNGVETLIDDDDTAIEYVSGQNTATLRINCMNTNFTIIRCKATNGELEDKSPSADVAIVYSIPEVRAHVFSPNGSTLRSSETSKTFKCELHTSKRVLTPDEVSAHFAIKWYRKPLVAGGTAKHIADGTSITIPAEELKLTGRNAMSIYPMVYSRGAYGYVTNSAGSAVITADGSIIISRT